MVRKMEKPEKIGDQADWPSPVEMDVNELKLDKRNFRIDFTDLDEGHTEDYRVVAEVVEKLFDEEEITEMAKEIVSFGRLYPHENLLAIKENGHNIVLEGNRRLLAIKCILDRKLVPKKHRTEFEREIGRVPDEVLASIRKIRVVFVPSRDATLRLIADKHSELSYKKWGLISQWRLIRERFTILGKDVDTVAESLGAERSTVVKSIKFSNLIDYIRSLSYWDDEGLRETINKNRLEPTRMTRALQYSDVVKALCILYDDIFSVSHSSEITQEKFDFVLSRFARASLTDSWDENITTRSSKEEVVSLIEKWKSEYDAIHQRNGAKEGGGSPTGEREDRAGGKKRGRKKGSEKYFRSLECAVSNPRLARLTEELSGINVTSFPAAAVMLTRALLETSLLFQIDAKGLTKKLKSGCKGGRCDLDTVISFTITNASALFKDKGIADSLHYLQGKGGHRRYMNDIVHGKWTDPAPAHVEAIAGDIRELLRAILNGDA